MFDPKRFNATDRHAEVYGFYEKLYTVVDFVASATFVVGSILFFYESLVITGTWLFLIGSICFGLRPTVKLLREFHLARLPLPGDDVVR
ncbi:MAG: YrhK family protein [Pseudomonadota bacterium]